MPMTAALVLTAAAPVPLTPARLTPVMVAPAPIEPTCLPASLARGATVVALAMHGGRGAATPFSIGQGDHALHTVRVTGSGRGDVVLVVAAYEPTVWDVSAIRGRLKAVVASGFYAQGVAGAGASVPLRFSSTLGSPTSSDPGCVSGGYVYGSDRDVERVADEVRDAVGAKPKRFYGGYAPTDFDIDREPPDAPRAAAAADVRAAAPILPGAGLAVIASSEEGMPRSPTRLVAWNAEGAMVWDEDGAPPPTTRVQYIDPYGRSRTSGSWIGWLVALAIGAMWWWRRRDGERAPASVQKPNVWAPPSHESTPPPAPEPEHATPASRRADLSELAAATTSEPLVVALHRYGRAVHAAAALVLDADLADEGAAIESRHFDHATTRWRHARPSLHGAEARHADEALRRAVDRLTTRLAEIADEQRRRDMNGIDAAERFITARHPTG